MASYPTGGPSCSIKGTKWLLAFVSYKDLSEKKQYEIAFDCRTNKTSFFESWLEKSIFSKVAKHVSQLLCDI